MMDNNTGPHCVHLQAPVFGALCVAAGCAGAAAAVGSGGWYHRTTDWDRVTCWQCLREVANAHLVLQLGGRP